MPSTTWKSYGINQPAISLSLGSHEAGMLGWGNTAHHSQSELETNSFMPSGVMEEGLAVRVVVTAAEVADVYEVHNRMTSVAPTKAFARDRGMREASIRMVEIRRWGKQKS